jgi:threonine dehydrogenase-like Zn-dependent dehydrogenase
MEMGADRCLDPSIDARQFLESSGLHEIKGDLVYELSGEPAALEYATHLTGMEGRIVVGSWYGNKEMRTCLGDDFHRNRLRIISSQVSRIDGSLSGRWSKSRRLGVAWKMIRTVGPSRLISHRFNITEASKAYRLLDDHGQDAIQVVLDYQEV